MLRVKSVGAFVICDIRLCDLFILKLICFLYYQVWYFILQYLNSVSARGMSLVECLSFLFQLSFSQLGKVCCFDYHKLTGLVWIRLQVSTTFRNVSESSYLALYKLVLESWIEINTKLGFFEVLNFKCLVLMDENISNVDKLRNFNCLKENCFSFLGCF